MGGLTSNSNNEKRNSAITSTLSASLSSSTTIAAGKGMYVTCSNRGILDQGNVVRGTYFPPLATSQDHQNLGTVAPSQTVAGASSMSNLNYSPSNHHHHHHLDHGATNNALHIASSNASRMSLNNSSSGSNSGSGSSALMATKQENNNILISTETATVSAQNGLTIDGYGNYDSITTVTAPMPTYASSPYTVQYKDYVNYHPNQSPTSNISSGGGGGGSTPIHSQHGGMVDEMDSREFEKYFKYPDSNHNFNEYDTNSAYHHGPPHPHPHSHPHHPNSIYHNHQLASNALPPHLLSSPHHPAAIAPQEYYQLYYHPNTNLPPGSTAATVTTGKLNPSKLLAISNTYLLTQNQIIVPNFLKIDYY